MNRLRKRISLRVESLENIALLSTISGMPVVAAATTGLGSVGSATPSDAQALQQDASGGYLEQFISEIEQLYGKRGNVKAYAQAVVADHSILNYDLETTAGALGVTLPIGIALPMDVQDAQQVLNAVRKGNLDQTYLKVMAAINTQDVANDRQLISTTTNSGVLAYAREGLPFDQNHVRGAQQLTKSPKSTYNPTLPTTSITPPPAVTTPASASDTQALQQDASGGALEVFISQVEELNGSRRDAPAYAQSVVGDHQVTSYDLETTARGAAVTLPSGITDASDIQDAQQVLAAVRKGKDLDKTYLAVMAQVNAQDVSNGQQLINSTQNTSVKAYAQETLAYDMTHLQGAQTLISNPGYTYTPGGF